MPKPEIDFTPEDLEAIGKALHDTLLGTNLWQFRPKEDWVRIALTYTRFIFNRFGNPIEAKALLLRIANKWPEPWVAEDWIEEYFAGTEETK